MNYDRVIVELLDRIARLEEKVELLEKEAKQKPSSTLQNSAKEAPKTQRDKTRYVFDGRVCLKNKLVLEVVRRYVSEHPQVSFEELRTVFCDKFNTYGVVRIRSEIDPKKQIRYFYNDKITLGDNTEVVVSNQWSKLLIEDFIELARSLGYEITEA